MGTPPKGKGRKLTSVKPKLPPFRLTYPPEIAQPKKAAWLPHALAFLRPFQYETDKKALKAGAEFVDGKTRFPLSAEAAARLVVKIASSFNIETYFEARAPRLKEIYSELSELSKTISKFCSQLAALNDVTLHELRSRQDRSLFYDDHVVSNMDIALTSELPRPANEKSSPEAHSWQGRLQALSRHAEFTKSRLQNKRLQQGRTPTDKGGRTNMFKETAGPPKWGLVVDCLAVFDAFKPGQATGHGEGPFHNFVAEVFELATGIESTDAAVADWVKRLVPVHRELKNFETEIALIFAEMLALERSDEVSTVIGEAKWLQLQQRLDELRGQETSLSERYFPHFRLSNLEPR